MDENRQSTTVHNSSGSSSFELALRSDHCVAESNPTRGDHCLTSLGGRHTKGVGSMSSETPRAGWAWKNPLGSTGGPPKVRPEGRVNRQNTRPRSVEGKEGNHQNLQERPPLGVWSWKNPLGDLPPGRPEQEKQSPGVMGIIVEESERPPQNIQVKCPVRCR